MLCLSAMAQKTTSKKDELTGKTIKTATLYLTGPISSNIQVISFEDNGTNKIASISLMGVIAGTIYNNYNIDSLLIVAKFDDGNILRLKPSSKYSKSIQMQYGPIVSMGHILTNEELYQFINHKILLLRIGLLDDRGYDLNISRGNQEKILKAANYVL